MDRASVVIAGTFVVATALLVALIWLLVRLDRSVAGAAPPHSEAVAARPAAPEPVEPVEPEPVVAASVVVREPEPEVRTPAPVVGSGDAPRALVAVAAATLLAAGLVLVVGAARRRRLPRT